MADQIEVNGLRVVAIIGALPHEREIPQPVQIDVSLEVDLRDAGQTDELDDTVNYGSVADRVTAVVAEAKDILLERLATRVANEVLAFDRVEAVGVHLTKVRPPLAVDAATTSVSIRRTRADAEIPAHSTNRSYIALGSNLGDRLGFLRMGVQGLGNVVSMSQVFETEPVGGPDEQGSFLNMVVELETTLDPFALLRRCQRIESEAMRQRTVHWGPRTLDVDIVLYDGVAINSEQLTIPHPRFAERRFVLAPLAEIANDLCPPHWDEQLEPMDVWPRGPLSLS